MPLKGHLVNHYEQNYVLSFDVTDKVLFIGGCPNSGAERLSLDTKTGVYAKFGSFVVDAVCFYAR